MKYTIFASPGNFSICFSDWESKHIRMADFAGAALGTLFSILYKVVENLVMTSRQFPKYFQDIKFTLDHLQPLIEQVEDLNTQFSLPSRELVEDFRKEIVEGIKLVNKCSKVSRWNGEKKYRYSKQLAELDGSLKRRLEILNTYGILGGRKDTKKLVRMTQRLYIALASMVAMVLMAISLFLWHNWFRLHGNYDQAPNLSSLQITAKEAKRNWLSHLLRPAFCLLEGLLRLVLSLSRGVFHLASSLLQGLCWVVVSTLLGLLRLCWRHLVRR
ncbi:hypothetical protein ABKV19_007322 [Rosa sericea]